MEKSSQQIEGACTRFTSLSHKIELKITNTNIERWRRNEKLS